MAGLLDTAGAPDVRPQVGEGRQREDMEVCCQVSRDSYLTVFVGCNLESLLPNNGYVFNMYHL